MSSNSEKAHKQAIVDAIRAIDFNECDFGSRTEYFEALADFVLENEARAVAEARQQVLGEIEETYPHLFVLMHYKNKESRLSMSEDVGK